MGPSTCTFLTLAGEKLPVAVDLHAHTSLRSFEEAVLAELPYIGSSSTLGCELQFVEQNTQQLLADPIQSKLRGNYCCYVIARPCLVEAEHSGQIRGEAKAIRVPRGKSNKIPPQAFSFRTEVRHVLVDPGIKVVGEAAWRSCRQLQVVQLPETVVSLLHGAFRCCQALRIVIAPGCQHFGPKVFEKCCSLVQIGITHGPSNTLAPRAQLRPRAFQQCTALQSLDLGKQGQSPTSANRTLPDCCFLEAGIVELCLPSDFTRIGAAACVGCQQLQTVDLSQTEVFEILGSTFAHCSQLRHLSLSKDLRIIDQEAFRQCIALQDVCLPSSLLYIARRAFIGCTQLKTVRRLGKIRTWRGTYAGHNAFDKCEQLEKPLWLRFLPSDDIDLREHDHHSGAQH